MARMMKLRIFRGNSEDGGLKDVTVEANEGEVILDVIHRCLLYTSPSPRDRTRSRMPSSA